MAKQIKTIKCPQCGSVQKTEVKPEHFRCDSCGTEYFLDNDDVNVNVRHTYNSSPPVEPAVINIKRIVIILGVLLVMFILLPIIIRGIFSNTGSNDNGITKSGTQSKYRYSIYEDTPVVIGGKPYIVCFGSRISDGYYDRQEEWVYCFYNIGADKVEGVTRVDGVTEHKSSDLRRFADGSIYLVLNEKFVYRLDREKMQFEDFMPRILEIHDDFRSGFASIKITYPRDGDAFDIMSNIGDEYKYYPIAKLVLTEKSAQKQSRGMNNLLPGARDSTYYMFTEEGFAYYGEGSGHPIQLMEVTFKYNAGGPLHFIQTAEYDMKSGASGVRLFYEKEDRIMSYHDLTPGRRFFDPYIAYMGHDDLLISVRANAASDAPVNIQKIDTQTGNVIWSTPVRTPDRRPFKYFDESIRVGDRYIVKDDHRIYLVLGNDGTLIKEINL